MSEGTPERDPTARERAGDGGVVQRAWAWLLRVNRYRDVWLLVVTVLVLVSVSASNAASDSADDTAKTANRTAKTTERLLRQIEPIVAQQGELLRAQRRGRAVALEATCAAVSAVIDAGRATITGSANAVPDQEFLRNLERLGYPPAAVRERQADDAARAYGLAISRRVEEATGQKGLARKDGTLNCAKLKRAAGVP